MTDGCPNHAIYADEFYSHYTKESSLRYGDCVLRLMFAAVALCTFSPSKPQSYAD